MVSSNEPMKAKLHDRPFDDPGWVFERKLDGIRALVRREGAAATLTSRTGRDLSPAYPELTEALREEPMERFLADGEIVAFEGRRTSFERLQGRMGIHDPRLAVLTGIPVYLYLFDLLELDGHDTTGLPLRSRKDLLRRSLEFRGPIRYTPHRNEHGVRLFREACSKGWEGLIAKRAESPYIHSRSRDWLKLKCSFEQELVIGGFTPPQGSRKHFGALLVGYYEDGELRYAGKVGTGFSERTLADLAARMEALEVPGSPFRRDGLPKRARWVRPELVGQFAFAEWTRDGKLRHPRYLGLREDKPASEVVRELPGG
ncbi:MAG TPA: non-homologous end-joining DNA ligase [Solirubrobacterales bacterium]|jgi:bifunctional non-homologous end joining protein LigD|nr:non-homologous end-joining DNA ligase [Solirubrobacterales bacterium]